jgi:hypothetical protein
VEPSSLTTGTNNTALGAQALFSLTTGIQNTATGAQALKNNRASQNTADGFQALVRNTTGADNTATGWRALFQNTTGSGNTATGISTLYSNTTGGGNTASGDVALTHNTTGSFNTANGVQALSYNTIGSSNTPDGNLALWHNDAGNNNTAVGVAALWNNSIGNGNIAVGAYVGSNVTEGNNNIDIGNGGDPYDSNTIRIGDPFVAQFTTYITGISGTAVTGASVVVTNSGKLGVAASSSRFKNKITAMDKVSEALFALKPVSFYYKKEIDPERTAQFGLIAEEVEKVNRDLVVRDKEGKPYSVRYDQVNAMLLNEFLKEHRKVENQTRRIQEHETTITQLKKEMETVVAHLKEQDSKIQKVSDRIELSKSATQLVLNVTAGD